MKATHRIKRINEEDDFYNDSSQLEGAEGTFELDIAWDDDTATDGIKGTVAGHFYPAKDIQMKNTGPATSTEGIYFFSVEVEEIK